MKVIKNQIFTGSAGRKSLYDCFYIEDGTPKDVVVFCHGFKGFKDWGCFNLMAEEFARKGFVFIKFNFAFNGGTIENPIDFPDLEAFSENNFSKEMEDLSIILNLLTNEEILPKSEFNPEKINLLGHSRGGGIVLLTQAKNPIIKKTITLASVADFAHFFAPESAMEQFKKDGVIYLENSRTLQKMPIKYQFYEDFEKHKNEFDILENVKKIKQPVLIIHGTEDQTVSYKSAEKLAVNIENSTLLLMEGADHTFGAYQVYDKDIMPRDFSFAVKNAVEFLREI